MNRDDERFIIAVLNVKKKIKEDKNLSKNIEDIYDTVMGEIKLLEKYVNEYNYSLGDLSLKASSYKYALKRKKIDPYIVGGLTNGALGAGAALYNALGTELNNEKIELNRVVSKEEFDKANEIFKKKEKLLLEKSIDVKNIIKGTILYDKVMDEYKNIVNLDKENEKELDKKVKKEKVKKNVNIIEMILIAFLAIFRIIGSVFWLVVLSIILVIGIDVLLNLYFKKKK